MVAIRGIREVVSLITLGFAVAVPQGFCRDAAGLQHPRPPLNSCAPASNLGNFEQILAQLSGIADI
jgi:hypothetical protein